MYKHELAWTVNDLYLHADSEILHVDQQNGKFQLWERHEVENAKDLVRRRFVLAGTGNTFEVELGHPKHVGSLLTESGTFVFHVFEIGTSPYDV